MASQNEPTQQAQPDFSGRAARVVAPPQFDAGWQLEYSVHRVNPILANDVKAAFRNEMEAELRKLKISAGEERGFLAERLLGVPTWQPAPTWDDLLKGDWASAKLDLSVYPSQEVNKVRKMLYLKAKAWAGKVRDALAKKNHWADASCPITGGSMYGERTSSVYNELEGLTHMLGYDSIPAIREVAAQPEMPDVTVITDAKELVEGDSCI